MNILTKISVVALTVLLIVFCVVVLQLATLQPNWKAVAEKQKQENLALVADRQQSQVVERRLNMDLAEQMTRAKNAQNSLSESMTDLTRRLDDERAKGAEQLAKLGGLDTSVKELRVDLQAKDKRIETILGDLAAANAKVNEKTEESRRFSDQLNEQTARADTATSIARYQTELRLAAEEKLADAERRLKEGVGVAKPGTPTPTPSPVIDGGGPILGTLLAVNIANNTASINCGSAKSVKAGMKAHVSRGSEYVCDIEITLVNTNDAAGLIVNKRMNPAQGDKFEIP